MQVPQLPARQPEAMLTPFASANSRIDPTAAFHGSALPALAKVTVICGPAATAAAAAGSGVPSFLTVAGPNASKWMLASGTPHSLSPSKSEDIIGGGPQR